MAILVVVDDSSFTICCFGGNAFDVAVRRLGLEEFLGKAICCCLDSKLIHLVV